MFGEQNQWNGWKNVVVEFRSRIPYLKLRKLFQKLGWAEIRPCRKTLPNFDERRSQPR